MKLLGQRILLKYRKKNLGNKALVKAINKLIIDIEENEIKNFDDLYVIRPDADRVHSDGYFILDLVDHRTMILVEIINDESTIIWCGNHDSYITTFKNNKRTIKKWLKSKNYIV